MTLLHQPTALTSACWRGPRTRARATANFLETKAADSLSGAGPPRHPSPLNKKITDGRKQLYNQSELGLTHEQHHTAIQLTIKQ